MVRKICVATGTRAEYGLLKSIINKINKDETLTLQLIVTGTHLSPEFGLTYNEIENDGYTSYEKMEILLSSDTPVGISKSIGLAVISASEIFDRIKPDMLVILGDRFEMLSIAIAATVSNIPISHLHGGELTEGAIDETIRHSITKMSYLHFAATESYRNRIIQLGEQPERVFNVGSLGIENIKNFNLIKRDELENILNFEFVGKTALVTFHPVTLEGKSSESQISELLNALDSILDLKIIFTKANSDTYGRIINEKISQYVYDHQEKSVLFDSLGMTRYLSVLNYVGIVVGNSSSGIIEVPSFKIPTVNIGDRQKGRLASKSVINCEANKNSIVTAINKGFSTEFRDTCKYATNPYECKNTSAIIIETIKNFTNINIKKTFYDYGGSVSNYV